MVKDGKYRYTLQFGMDTEAERRAGTFLERLGNRKSPFIVAAINECLESHPELCEDQHKVQFTISGIDPKQLEAKIRQIVEERLGAGPIPLQLEASAPDATQQVSNDILDMLSDLDYFG
mgnify:FL=1